MSKYDLKGSWRLGYMLALWVFVSGVCYGESILDTAVPLTESEMVELVGGEACLSDCPTVCASQDTTCSGVSCTEAEFGCATKSEIIYYGPYNECDGEGNYACTPGESTLCSETYECTEFYKSGYACFSGSCVPLPGVCTLCKPTGPPSSVYVYPATCQ